MTFSIGWPQAVWFILAAMSLIEAIVFHGQSRSPFNAFNRAIDISVMFFLIYWGGFFG